MRAASSALVLLVCATAAADSKVADEAFARGRTLMKQKKFAEACASFEQSYRLDPELGTLFNLADCEEQLGKLATAWNHYRELAKTDTNAERRAMSDKLAKQIAPRVPKIVVTIAQRPDGATLTIDGKDSTELLGTETPIDLGQHQLVVHAAGFADYEETLDIKREGSVQKIVVHLQLPGHEPEHVAPVATDEPRDDSRARWGKYTLIGGGVVLAGGLAVGGLAYSQWQHAQSCTNCNRSSEAHSAVIRGDLSTALCVVGAAAAAAGVYLWRSGSSAVAPAPGGVAIVGRF